MRKFQLCSVLALISLFQFSVAKIKVVSFDVGDTLIQVDRKAIPVELVKIANTLDANSKIDPSTAVPKFWSCLMIDKEAQAAMSVIYDKDKLMQKKGDIIRLLSKWASEIGFPVEKTKELMISAMATLPAPGSAIMKCFPDAIPALEQLTKQNNLKLIVVSNWDSGLHKNLEHNGLSKYFDYVVASGDVKIEKPNPGIFQHALAEINKIDTCLNCSPDEVLHVGDHADQDVAGAKSAGMKAVLLDRNEKNPDNLNKINTLSALSEVIKKLDEA
jgi:HAD superfamily hydrolase (TIGR01549 family)